MNESTVGVTNNSEKGKESSANNVIVSPGGVAGMNDSGPSKQGGNSVCNTHAAIDKGDTAGNQMGDENTCTIVSPVGVARTEEVNTRTRSAHRNTKKGQLSY